MKLNNKGFYTAVAALILLFGSLTVVTILAPLVNNIYANILEMDSTINEGIENRNSFEKSKKVLFENMSSVGSFEKDGVMVNIEEISVNVEPINISGTASVSKTVPFKVYNKTPISIYASFARDPELAPEEPAYYNITISSPKLLMENPSGTNFISSSQINIAESETYNVETGRTNYGEYSVTIYPYNGTVNYSIGYSKMYSREINLNVNDDYTIPVLINIDEAGEMTIDLLTGDGGV